MSNEIRQSSELAMNIDIVRSSTESKVLLANTGKELSVGIIFPHTTNPLVAWLGEITDFEDDNIDTEKLPLIIYEADNSEDAFRFANSIISHWVATNSSDFDFKVNKDMVTFVAKDAPPEKQMETANKVVLSDAEIASRKDVLNRIHENGKKILLPTVFSYLQALEVD